jgi:hypothetical protein
VMQGVWTVGCLTSSRGGHGSKRERERVICGLCLVERSHRLQFHLLNLEVIQHNLERLCL